MWLTPHKTRVTLLSKKLMWSYASDTSSKTCVTRVTEGDVTLCDSQFLTKPCDTAGCQRWHIPQNASWRLGGGEARKTLGPSQTGRTHALKLSSMYCMEAKARIFVCIRWVNSEHHRRASSEHHHRHLINQARVYVCSGRAGGNERLFIFRSICIESWPYRAPSLWMN